MANTLAIDPSSMDPGALTSEFRSNVKTPDALRDEVTHCLLPKTAASHKKQYARSKSVVRADLLPRSHNMYPSHCLLLMSDGTWLLLTLVLLLRLAETLPWLGPFKRQGPHTAFRADRFKGLPVRYRWYNEVAVVYNGGELIRAISATYVEPVASDLGPPLRPDASNPAIALVRASLEAHAAKSQRGDSRGESRAAAAASAARAAGRPRSRPGVADDGDQIQPVAKAELRSGGHGAPGLGTLVEMYATSSLDSSSMARGVVPRAVEDVGDGPRGRASQRASSMARNIDAIATMRRGAAKSHRQRGAAIRKLPSAAAAGARSASLPDLLAGLRGDAPFPGTAPYSP